MSKKFGKILLFTAAIGTAAAAAYYYMRKKDADMDASDVDDDYDDFSEDLEEDTEEDLEASRNYVPLTPPPAGNASTEDGSAKENIPEAAADAKDDFTPLAQQVAENAKAQEDLKADETVEEFFDEDEEDAQQKEPSITED